MSVLMSSTLFLAMNLGAQPCELPATSNHLHLDAESSISVFNDEGDELKTTKNARHCLHQILSPKTNASFWLPSLKRKYATDSKAFGRITEKCIETISLSEGTLVSVEVQAKDGRFMGAIVEGGPPKVASCLAKILRSSKLELKNTTRSCYTRSALVNGEDSREEIRQIVVASQSALRQCYTRALENDPMIAGEVLMTWMIEAEGSTSKIEVKKNTVGPAVGACIVKVLSGLNFANRKCGVPVKVTYPFIFKKEKRR